MSVWILYVHQKIPFFITFVFSQVALLQLQLLRPTHSKWASLCPPHSTRCVSAPCPLVLVTLWPCPLCPHSPSLWSHYQEWPQWAVRCLVWVWAQLEGERLWAWAQASRPPCQCRSLWWACPPRLGRSQPEPPTPFFCEGMTKGLGDPQ